MNVSYKAPVCGNKVVELGEACDCGSAEVGGEPWWELCLGKSHARNPWSSVHISLWDQHELS